MTPGETLGTLYNIHVGSNKTKQHGETLGTLYNIHVGSNKTKQHSNKHVTVTKTPLSPSAYTSSRLSVLMRTGGKHTLQRPKHTCADHVPACVR